ncbi:MAG: TolB family protein [Acidobacteria bacterium]|nr:TolB family protein [Acidobacteriota bacterium]MBI3426650.1 TolB family protein [Acidobacteriota bacterium]
MKQLITICLLAALALFLRASSVSSQQPTPTPIGSFDNHSDVGAVQKPGSAEYDAMAKTYTITGGGENMWAATDGFHFVWKRLSGDVSLAADIKILGTGGNAHRKGVLIIRQSLDADSAYADAALHGDGLTSLQYREVKGGPTREIQSNVKGPARLRIEKEGDYVFMSLLPTGAPAGEKPRSAGGSFRLKLNEPFYVGLGVCAHDNNASEKAVFSNVELINKPRVVESTLETVAIASKDRKVVYTAEEHFEAPNWSRDGKYFLFNRAGRMVKMPVTGGTIETLDTGFATRCNNDHGISPDGQWLAISDQSQEQRRSLIYVLPITGGTPRRITKLAPSYWHGWSPDGKTLVYCADRNGNFDVYSIPVEGPFEEKAEKRLTTADGLDDGPEYSPDGQYIYFNSVRTGLMQIWRMKADGSEQTQITKDDYNNWFAHPSPDGKWLALVTFEKDVVGHPANKDVMLRLISVTATETTLSYGEPQVLAKLFGGQGTINVPSWSPDSKQLAFVSYRLVSK